MVERKGDEMNQSDELLMIETEKITLEVVKKLLDEEQRGSSRSSRRSLEWLPPNKTISH